MPNPYLPNWEYIPDGEPHVFGERVYVYGSHDRVDSEHFCDFKLKVWSASIDDLDHWKCHGDIFRTRPGGGRPADADWSERELYAPDVVEKDGKYYLYAYIVDSKGCVAVSDKPEGPFKLLSQYQYNIPEHYDDGTFIDPGVLVDDDGRVYVYCGFEGSYMCEMNPDNMYEVLDGTYQTDIIPVEEPFRFFEACSPRKVGNTYYLIYSPKTGSRLAYATSSSPAGPFTYRGYIIDNGVDFPGGNNHGSICQINGQWYIFYHRMTNSSIMSRRGCVERIEILPDGSIPTVEMTSLGFSQSLNPYETTLADTACVLKSGALITELDLFTRIITNITDGCVMGWKYYDFGEDYTNEDILFAAKLLPRGCHGRIRICIDNETEEIGSVEFFHNSAEARGKVKNVTGTHAVYLIAESGYTSWAKNSFQGRQLFDLISFVFCK
ncbi:xylan 1,4-beta-xylosidase [bacterium D16-51]|nr:xylan 1,4-beta-xylosidase [bacterium D16-59]RKI61168.1 xylan 1,4-beta-xylosidase [bacterium D16-51]